MSAVLFGLALGFIPTAIAWWLHVSELKRSIRIYRKGLSDIAHLEGLPFYPDAPEKSPHHIATKSLHEGEVW